ncbi:hypothetical protein FHR23_000805 [Stakelama sediminis]|uniref:Uncharacterized protein n=2 Tax=Stakelama sediminis TaxID=463200 RepID=A0A840YW71_9SPHN|nr:hypothetical protein [Stakelama sediminis]MBB5717898.1 hypothetical protein [Stakelama sediminis]
MKIPPGKPGRFSVGAGNTTRNARATGLRIAALKRLSQGGDQKGRTGQRDGQLQRNRKGGKPANCTVVQSSGSAALDTQSCTLMTKRFRYHPARDAHHHRVAQHMNQVFDWSLGKCPPLGPTDICITPN